MICPPQAPGAARPTRAHSRARAHRINTLIIQGATPDEIAADLGVTVDAVWKLRRRWGHALAQRRGARRLFVWVADSHVETIDRMAADQGADRARALSALVEGILSRNADEARLTWARVRRMIQEAS